MQKNYILDWPFSQKTNIKFPVGLLDKYHVYTLNIWVGHMVQWLGYWNHILQGPGANPGGCHFFFLVLFYDYQEKHIRRNHLFLTNTVNVKIQILHQNIILEFFYFDKTPLEVIHF